MADVN